MTLTNFFLVGILAGLLVNAWMMYQGNRNSSEKPSYLTSTLSLLLMLTAIVCFGSYLLLLYRNTPGEQIEKMLQPIVAILSNVFTAYVTRLFPASKNGNEEKHKSPEVTT